MDGVAAAAVAARLIARLVYEVKQRGGVALKEVLCRSRRRGRRLRSTSLAPSLPRAGADMRMRTYARTDERGIYRLSCAKVAAAAGAPFSRDGRSANADS